MGTAWHSLSCHLYSFAHQNVYTTFSLQLSSETHKIHAQDTRPSHRLFNRQPGLPPWSGRPPALRARAVAGGGGGGSLLPTLLYSAMQPPRGELRTTCLVIYIPGIQPAGSGASGKLPRIGSVERKLELEDCGRPRGLAAALASASYRAWTLRAPQCVRRLSRAGAGVRFSAALPIYGGAFVVQAMRAAG